MPEQSRQVRKRALIDAVAQFRQAGQNAVKRGHGLVLQGQFIDTLGECVESIARSIPDDSYVESRRWDRATQALRDHACFIESVVSDAGVGLKFLTASSTITASDFVFPQAFTRPLPAESQENVDQALTRLDEIVGSSVWEDELELDFRRLGLEITRPDNRSALQLLAASHDALTKPSGAEPDPIHVLIPLRESIQRTLADLLPRRAKQQPASGIEGKVRSLCTQLGKAGLPASQIDRLADEARELNSLLSAAKQEVVGISDLRARFMRGKAFLKALLSVIDENSLRP